MTVRNSKDFIHLETRKNRMWHLTRLHGYFTQRPSLIRPRILILIFFKYLKNRFAQDLDVSCLTKCGMKGIKIAGF